MYLFTDEYMKERSDVLLQAGDCGLLSAIL